MYDDDGEATIFCNAVHNKPATEIAWSVAGATGTVTPPADPATTVGPAPTDVVTIQFTGGTPGGTLSEKSGDAPGYQIDLAFSDNDGTHDAEYPSLSQPSSIQAARARDQGEARHRRRLRAVDRRCRRHRRGRARSLRRALQRRIAVRPRRCQRRSADVVDQRRRRRRRWAGVGQLRRRRRRAVQRRGAAQARLRALAVQPAGVGDARHRHRAGRPVRRQDLDFEAALGPFSVVAGTSAFDDGGTPDDDTDDRRRSRHGQARRPALGRATPSPLPWRSATSSPTSAPTLRRASGRCPTRTAARSSPTHRPTPTPNRRSPGWAVRRSRSPSAPATSPTTSPTSASRSTSPVASS